MSVARFSSAFIAIQDFQVEPMLWKEVNFDGLVGPTHNYAGLSFGNLASEKHRNVISRPKMAALQGIEKMRMLYDLGVEQAVLPPQLRPDLHYLRSCGFSGSPNQLILQAAEKDPIQLAAATSAASMWTANAATVSPSCDTTDQKLHLTPANLISGVHRSLECPTTMRVLEAIFSGAKFQVHPALPSSLAMSDEGAANQMRLAPKHAEQALEIFVFGRDAFRTSESQPTTFPARQTRQAFEAIARRHQLDDKRALFWKQNPAAIDCGAFHNDVVAVANENVLFCHEDAFENQAEKLESLQSVYREHYDADLFIVEISRAQVSLQEAVKSYLFNSQIVTKPDGRMTLVAPRECSEIRSVNQVIEQVLRADNPIQDVVFPDVRQSMMNGGGPACLRLRVVMNEQEISSIHQDVRFSPELENALIDWVKKHYRDEIAPNDLLHVDLYGDCLAALQELETILGFESGVIVPCNFVAGE